MIHHLDLAEAPRSSLPSRRGSGITPYVAVGEKEVYNWNDPADAAEYRTVLGYRQR
ncbi:hypothetical protein [Dactylosporangium sp. NPDC000521]|uniref:hypothetical protein n=1 Tax=Dactylosporangium sp. NPDC000521 TaxID=3363975 RepID=UPI0036777E4B